MNLWTILKSIKVHSEADKIGRELVAEAYTLAELIHEGQRRVSGEPYFQHCLAVASMLAELRLDPRTIAAGLLHDVVEDSLLSVQDLEGYFGEEVADLVDGVTKLGEIELSKMGRLTYDEKESESLRKMFLAMFRDVRVVLIKLADRLHNMRTLGSLPEERRKRLARETLEIFAPLANRLGIWQWKWELENLGLRYLNPRRYREIARLVAVRQPLREGDIQHYVDVLYQQLAEERIPNEHISGRPKHIYSIYRKMERKGLPFDQIYDMRGIRVIVDTIAQCYRVLGIVHGLWRPIPGEFDDYIATPKDNMYRSLHTAVVADDGKTLEVQIRTREMHETAEFGIAAHWRYKEGGKQHDIEFKEKINWLRMLMEWRDDITNGTEFIASLKTDVFQDRVYTFTPRGDVIDLPSGSTAIDFAYHIHTEIGHRCRGTKVNGKLVGLDYQLENGDQVSILTTKRGGPSRDWLNPALGYTKTTRARSKIRQWFRRQKRGENIALGRDLLERELKRLGVGGMTHEKVFQLFNDERYEKTEDFMAALGYGDVSNQQIATRIIEAERRDKVKEEIELPTLPPATSVVDEGVTVMGTGGLLTRLARCCNPVPGDEIIGYVTRGRGVTVHRRDCPNMLRVDEQERLIEVDWGAEKKTYPVTIHITAYDRGGLMRDISAVVAAADINVTSFNVTKSKNIANLSATLEISEFAELSSVLAQIERLPNVVRAQRHAG